MSIQRQLPGYILLDTERNSFGSKGTHLPLEIDPNEPLPGAGTTAQVQARRPYPAYGNLIYLESADFSTYHSLQVKIEKRTSHNLAFLLAETYAKSIDAGAQAGSTSNSSTGVGQQFV